ncbi:MAG: NADH:ubiquinone oxidoreductase [Thermodesulfobacteriota bacterium]
MPAAPPDLPRRYLGVPLWRPRAAFFELTSCEGCQLQILNNEDTLLDFLSFLEVVQFREAMTEKAEDYEIAFVEGAVSRADEEERLRRIRAQAQVLVALGSCAAFGGVNQLRNRWADPALVVREVYGEAPVETALVRPLSAVVPVDLMIFGCPIRKEEVERIVCDLALGKTVTHPAYPVCLECKANENLCLFDLGEPCLGPITRGGCNAWCPNERAGCWGCRGPAEDANVAQLLEIMRRHGFSDEAFRDRLECFGGFASLPARPEGLPA